MKTRNWLLGLILIPLVSCGQDRTLHEEVDVLLRKTVPIVSKSDLDEMAAKGVSFHLLDCRAAEEFAVSHLPNAEFSDYGTFEADQLGGRSKEDSIIVYCSIGYRSERIGEKLQNAGYKHVFNLYGGIFDWTNNGGALVNPQNLSTDSVHTYNKQWSRFLEKGVKVY